MPVLPSTGQPLVKISNISQTEFLASWQDILNAVAYKLVLRGGGLIDKREVLVR